MKTPSILIACECSGRVREAFRRRGWDAWSCDLKPAEDGSPYHLVGDALEAIRIGSWVDSWDAMIAHPVCRYLANSGVRWLVDKEGNINQERWELAQLGADFFRSLCEAPIRFRAIENPIQHKYALQMHEQGKATQYIQPWQHGHTESKATGLWLYNLPKLVPSNVVYDEMMALPVAERNKVHRMPPGPEREANRSRTYQGIANAMADQWGAYMERELRV